MRQPNPVYPLLDSPRPVVERSSASIAAILVGGGLGALLAWAYWPTLTTLSARWTDDPNFSHGFLVPLFALMILWFRRSLMPRHWPAGSAWGLAIIAAALALRGVLTFLLRDALDALSLPPMLAGLVLLVGGWPTLRWAWPAIAFLGFMLPLPFSVEVALAMPLRRLGAVISTFFLQLLGYPALAEGNVIVIDDLRLGVIDACNGLGMLMTFFALAVAFALVIDRPLPDRLFLVASAVPIALIVNVVRITGTAVAHVNLGPETANALLHGLAGWLMMPLALALLWAEMKYLDFLLPYDAPSRPLPLRLEGERPFTYVRQVPEATP